VSRVRLMIALCALLAPVLAVADTGLSAVLKGSAFERFTDIDYQSFFETAGRAASGPLGQRVEWSNPKSGAHGAMQAVREFRRYDTDCRELRGESTAAGRTDPFRIAVCKDAASGKWRLAPSEPRAKSTQSGAANAAPPAADKPQE
jgi:surface antigen